MRANSDLAGRRLGETDLVLSELGFGAASLGNLYRVVSEENARKTIEQAWHSGMRYFDTAPYYGFGLSERRVGDYLRQHSRDDFVISTKVGRLLKPADEVSGADMRHGFCSPMPFEPNYDYTYDGVMRSFESSVQRLGLSRIDILLVHDIGELTHGAENAAHFRDLEKGGCRALEELRDAGDIHAFGLGVNEWEICVQAMEIARFDCFLLAGRYSLLEQESSEKFFPQCAAHGATLIIGGAYNSGILATGVKKGVDPYYNYAPAPPDIIERVRAIEDLCEKHKVSLPAAAIQFPMKHELSSSVVIGLGDSSRVTQTIEFSAERIPAQFWAEMKAQQLILETAPTP